MELNEKLRKTYNLLQDATVLVTGGTGSFGHAFVERVIGLPVKEIRILSRDEKKQDEMRRKLATDRVKFYLGDVRDKDSIKNSFKGVDYIFHAAALKQVPVCEFFPVEAVKTNILGTANVIDLAIEHEVKKVVALSTDKAVYPINAMGMTKALLEKIAISRSRDDNKTIICVTRYGNVLASRGSVIPVIVDQLKSGKTLTITNPEMTRFLLTLGEAIDLVLFAFANGESGAIYVKKSPATKISTLIEAVVHISGKSNVEKKIIGMRHGEKVHETLISKEEMARAKDLGEFFSISPDTRDLNYDIFTIKGEERINKCIEYTSETAPQLNLEQTVNLLLSSNIFRSFGDLALKVVD